MIKINIDQWRDQIDADLKRNIQKAGFYAASQLRRSLNTDQPYRRGTGRRGVYYRGLNPSRPGAYPHKLSGQLVKSITFNARPDGLVVGSSLAKPPYPYWLAKGTRKLLPRPWLQLFYRAESQNIAKIMLTGKR